MNNVAKIAWENRRRKIPILKREDVVLMYHDQLDELLGENNAWHQYFLDTPHQYILGLHKFIGNLWVRNKEQLQLSCLRVKV